MNPNTNIIPMGHWQRKQVLAVHSALPMFF